jgi:hypothetical protein
LASRSQKIESLVRNAHRRCLALLYLEQSAIAASFVFAGCALVLIVGTQLLNWYWLVLLGALGVAIAAMRVRRRLSSPYVTAQALDSRLALFDSISTAWHVTQTPSLADTPAGRLQLSQAEILAAEIDPKCVFPVKLQRSWTFALAVAAIALSLFSVRYLVQRNMNLSHALVPLHLDQLTAALRSKIGEAGQAEPSPSLAGNQKNETQQARAQGTDPRMNDVLGMKNPVEAPSKEGGAQNNSGSAKSADDGNSPLSGKTPGGENPSDKASASSSKDTSNGAAKSDEQGNQSQASEDQKNESLMSRMKDAASSFMAKMKPDNPSQSPQASSQNSAAPDQDQTQNENGQSQSQTSASQSAQAQSKSDAKSSAQAQATEMSQAGDSRNSGNSENKEGNQSKSGIGKQDGGKEVKLAQEQEAMGKLAEIIGKRSRDLSGEMMVEVPSGRQQLRTAYTGQVAEHSDKSGEINRDEIPVALQPYVREYMELVRRDANAKKAADTK